MEKEQWNSINQKQDGLEQSKKEKSSSLHRIKHPPEIVNYVSFHLNIDSREHDLWLTIVISSIQ